VLLQVAVLSTLLDSNQMAEQRRLRDKCYDRSPTDACERLIVRIEEKQVERPVQPGESLDDRKSDRVIAAHDTPAAAPRR